ncbi:MAG: flagellar hook-associated protein FlgK [Candidatus Zixiibacteriota bacterium]
MADLLGLGLSGMLASQQGMSTTGHNISNVSTPGFSRQAVVLTERIPTGTGAGFFGNGVDVTSVERRYDQFLTSQVWSNTSNTERLESFYHYASQIDNLLADPQAGLSPAIQSFFNSIQGLSNDPASIPARQVVLSEAESLVDRFHVIDSKFSELNQAVNSEIEGIVGEINTLAESLARIKRDIIYAEGRFPGQPANDLRDQRDYLVQQLSERINVNVLEQDNGSYNVFIGSGQTLVLGEQAFQLNASDKSVYAEPERMEITLSAQGGAAASVVTNLLEGGSLGGLLDFRSETLDPAMNSMGRLALGVTAAFNEQHRLGIDLMNNFGEDFFTDITATAPAAYKKYSNTGDAELALDITDVSALNGSDYTLRFDGINYLLLRGVDNQTITLSNLPLGTETVDGLTISIASGAMNAGDSFLIRPTAAATGMIGVEITNAQSIAAAGPVRALTSADNQGIAQITPPDVVDTTTYVADNYTIYGAASALSLTDGLFTTEGALNDDATTANDLQYRLEINGYTVYTQTEADAPLTDLASLAAAINDDTATTGVRAYVYDTGVAGDPQTLSLVRVPPSSLPITVSEYLEDVNGVPMDAADTVTGYFGSALAGDAVAAAVSNDVVFSAVDTYVVTDSTDAVVTSGAYVQGGTIAFNGIETSITGAMELGDNFTVLPNTGGVSDNRNALKLALLQTEKVLNNGTTNFQSAYGQTVAEVGTRTHRVDLDLTASKTMLNQAIEAKEAVSGVNLDEEAANLLRYQQLYQASAQVIAMSRSLFQSLLDAVR